MRWVRREAPAGCVLPFLASLRFLALWGSHSAHARTWHRARAHHAEAYAPPSAAIVVDGNSGGELYASNADAQRHPASLTKIMTLYLLFERLEAGRIRLDTPLKVSEHASDQAPTKLGLKPGQTIAVEDAIKAVVTKSANDAAVAIAENLGGDEESFARLMTQKARALGMARTTYVNASGLPNDDQLTTARDQALLGRVIQERFPRYYRYFSTEAFVYHGSAMRNHNHLLGEVGGVDGIKTGYTRASGFNLVTSVHRDGRYIVAVVLGGRSAGERDARMRELIRERIKEAAVRRTAPSLVADATEPRSETQAPATVPVPAPVAAAAPAPKLPAPAPKLPAAAARAAATPQAPAPAANTPAPGGANDPIQPVLVRTISYHTAPLQTAALSPMPALVPVAAPLPLPTPPAAAPTATAARTQPPQPAEEEANTVMVASPEPASVATVSKAEAAQQSRPAKIEQPPSPAVRARGGWIIQVGAYEAEEEARQHLTAAQTKAPGMFAAADPFTERVKKGEKSFYRARFAGFDRSAAEATCKLLKRSDIECMAVKN